MKDYIKKGIDKFFLKIKIPYFSFLVLRNKELELKSQEMENAIQIQDKILGKIGPGFRCEFNDKDLRNFRKKSDEYVFEIKPFEIYPHTVIKVNKNDDSFEEKLLYGHLGLAKLITEYEFENILDIGSFNGTSARLFSFLGKNVTTIEISEDFKSDYVGDYLDVSFPEKFDAIWCSHVLEHQRNIGLFLDKIYQDLRENGVLAMTIPASLYPLIIGHPSIFTPLHLIYHLVLAGFDCKNARIKNYDWQYTIILQKKSNGIKSVGFALTHYPVPPITFTENLFEYFPVNIPENGHIWGDIESLNWD